MSHLNFYDESTGIYYQTIYSDAKQQGMLSKKSGSHPCNLGIYLPEKDQSLLLFDAGEEQKISSIYMETKIEDNKVEFNGGETYDSHVKNNNVNENHILNDKLLIVTSDDKNHQTQLWAANKDGSNRHSLKTFSTGISWHIDVKNVKIRVVTAKASGFSVESLDW